MKKKTKYLLIFLTLIFFTTGCTTRFVDKQTNKSYTANIMCKPSSEKYLKVYQKNKKELDVKLDKLPECEDFKVTSGKYESLFNSLFTKPLAWIVIFIGKGVKNYGISILIVGLVIRLLLLPITKKSAMQSENMKKAGPEIQKLERKYKNKTDRDSMMMKSQEQMLIYKKYDINPMSGCLFAFLQLPILFAFYEAINRVPAFFEENLWKLQLGTTPLEGIQSGNYVYLIIVGLILLTTYLSFKNMNTTGDDEQAKQMRFMSIFMMVFIGFASFSLPIAIALYWILSSTFTIIQNYHIKNSLKKNKEDSKSK